jgi:hypothetical protein
MGLAELWCVCLDKIARSNAIKFDGPWQPLPSYSRYGPTPPATKHATINLHHMQWVYLIKTREKNIITSNMAINAHRIDNNKQRLQCSNAMMGALQPVG